MLLGLGNLYAQKAPVQGIAEKTVSTYAYTQATVHLENGQILNNATILVHDGRIIALGAQIAVPAGAIVADLEGKHVYPSFIELQSSYGTDVPKNKKGDPPVYESTQEGAYYWNDAIRAHINAGMHIAQDPKKAKELRNAGFGLVVSHSQDGISRGLSVGLTLEDGKTGDNLVAGAQMPYFSFKKGSSHMAYPSSLMGSIALLRQALYDAQAYKSDKQQPENLTLVALKQQMKNPGFFEVQDKWDIYRAEKIAKEFGISWTYIGGNDIYENPDAFKNMNLKLVVPIMHPKAYDASDPLATSMLGMEDLKAYDWAPTNLASLDAAGINYSLSASALEKAAELMGELRSAIAAGAKEEKILDALSIVPARMAGIDKDYGSVSKGKWANFLITDAPIFEKGAKILQHVIKGENYDVNPTSAVSFAGDYQVKLDGINYGLTISEDDSKATLTKLADSSKVKTQMSKQGYALSLAFKGGDEDGYYRIHARKKGKDLYGSATAPNGMDIAFSAIYQGNKDQDQKDEEKEQLRPVSAFSYPLKAFGYGESPKKEGILIKNTTVWTNEKEGILQNTDVLLVNGYITQIGKNLPGQGYKVIDGTGKHLTAGIVDEHSHIAITRGVNEGGQAISAEVSISDVVNPDDINIYRQLSGGVTTAQLLHGSANPIGGRSALIKLKYGSTPEEMKIANAPGFIKFALGENVKQSNWGSDYNTRYPQTRMGVEQLYYDAFHRALEYREARKGKNPPAKNIEYEVLLEILDGTRYISCHSYIQSEINMLMHVADSMGFTLNTFTHILEGYKVADKMAAHGASGSTFSDWWAYKFEVKDAIPYNAALMHEQGVNVGINSDDAEMGRRLNQEASKAVKYGGVSKEEALKMVTLNPAKMLHLDDKIGSIKIGKQADVVLWSAEPLTQQARSLYTIIEGAIYYSEAQEAAAMQRDAEDRTRIINKMLADKYQDKKKPSTAKREKMYHCDTENY